MKIFKDRKSAGQLLAKELKNTKADLVLAIPRGGVVVGMEIAKALKTPLDILVIRKIGAPGQTELALGAIAPDGEVGWDQDLLEQVHPNRPELAQIIKDEWRELKRREDAYRAGQKELPLNGKRIILVDDGIATGSTILSAIEFLKRHQVKQIILAIPVASQDSLEKVTRVLNRTGRAIVLEVPDHFQSVGQFYAEFLPVSDSEVVKLLHD